MLWAVIDTYIDNKGCRCVSSLYSHVLLVCATTYVVGVPTLTVPANSVYSNVTRLPVMRKYSAQSFMSSDNGYALALCVGPKVCVWVQLQVLYSCVRNTACIAAQIVTHTIIYM